MSPVFLPFNANLTSVKRWSLLFSWGLCTIAYFASPKYSQITGNLAIVRLMSHLLVCQVKNQIEIKIFVQEQQHLGPLWRNGFLADARCSRQASTQSLEQNRIIFRCDAMLSRIKFQTFDQCQNHKILWYLSGFFELSIPWTVTDIWCFHKLAVFCCVGLSLTNL